MPLGDSPKKIKNRHSAHSCYLWKATWSWAESLGLASQLWKPFLAYSPSTGFRSSYAFLRSITQARNDGSDWSVYRAKCYFTNDEISAFSKTPKRKLNTVIPRILVIYEKQHVRERNPLALQVNYEAFHSLFAINRISHSPDHSHRFPCVVSTAAPNGKFIFGSL